MVPARLPQSKQLEMQKIVIATVEFPLETQALNKSLRSSTDTKIKRVIGLKITLVQFTCPNKGHNRTFYGTFYSLLATLNCKFIMMTSQKQEGGGRNDPSNKEEETK